MEREVQRGKKECTGRESGVTVECEMQEAVGEMKAKGGQARKKKGGMRWRQPIQEKKV